MKKVLILISVLILVLVQAPMATLAIDNSGLKKVEITKDWIVTGNEVHESEEITLKGKLFVERGGSLVLNNCQIRIVVDNPATLSYEDLTRIRARDGGSLQVNNSGFTTNSSKGLLITTNNNTGLVSLRGSEFFGVGIEAWHTENVNIENNRFYLSNNYNFPGISVFVSSKAKIRGNRIVPVDDKNFVPRRDNKEIFICDSEECEIVNNYISGMNNGINGFTASNNVISGNTIIGADSPPNLKEKATNWWVASSFDKADGAIGLERWSNNNIIENNTMISSGSAMFLIFQSENNIIRNNQLKGAGYGLALKYANNTVINNNTLTDIWDDAIQIYRSDNVQVLNNRLTAANVGVSIFHSTGVLAQANLLEGNERGFFLFSADNNKISNNSITGSYEGVIAADSTNNTVSYNNLNNTVRNTFDNRTGNLWQGNYWGQQMRGFYTVSSNVKDLEPASVPNAITQAQSIPAALSTDDKLQHNSLVIRDRQVWENQDLIMKESIIIESGASLVLKKTNLTYKPEGMVYDIWIHVKPGGTLEIYDSQIIGPEKRHALSIKVYKDAKFVMKNSLLENAGSWVGTFAAAIALENTGSIIENNTIKNTYCAICTEHTLANVRIVNNKIINSIKGITLIGSNPNSTISGNTISKTAYWGLQHFGDQVDGKTCVIENNTFSDSWGVGIYETMDKSATIKNNAFIDIKGAGMLIHGLTEKVVNKRELRVLAYPAAGEIAVKLGNTELYAGNEPHAFKPMDVSAVVYINGKAVARQKVNLKFGEYKRVVLRSNSIKLGNYSVVIEGPRIN